MAAGSLGVAGGVSLLDQARLDGTRGRDAVLTRTHFGTTGPSSRHPMRLQQAGIHLFQSAGMTYIWTAGCPNAEMRGQP